jgi:hypothetical protein
MLAFKGALFTRANGEAATEIDGLVFAVAPTVAAAVETSDEKYNRQQQEEYDQYYLEQELRKKRLDEEDIEKEA